MKKDEDFVGMIFGSIMVLIIIVILILVLRSCESTDLNNEIHKADTIVIDGKAYNTDDIVEVYVEGGLYDESYTIILEDGTEIHFREYKLQYK